MMAWPILRVLQFPGGTENIRVEASVTVDGFHSKILPQDLPITALR
jgi:hypothetical protein